MPRRDTTNSCLHYLTKQYIVDRGQSNFLEHLQGPNNEKSEQSFFLIFVGGQPKAAKAVFVLGGFFKSA